MSVRIENTDGNLSRWQSGLAGWEIPRMTREMFYTQLDRVFAETQAFTHVETGSLKASGKVHSSYDATRSVLEGYIEYGGSAPGGVHDPVRYAVYEAARGPEHDPLTPLYTAEPEFEALFSHGDVMFKGNLN